MRFPTHLKQSEPNTAYSLAQERKKANFPGSEMDVFINGDSYSRMREKALQVIRAEPEIFDLRDFYNLSRVEKFDHAYKIELRLVQLFREKKITKDEFSAITQILGIPLPYSLSRSMFTTTLENQCNAEQKKAFLEPTLDYRIIGCYAQTEMGHGSNVRGIETTATFIEETDEFELNMPTLTATKWWIGTLGVGATHAIVMAQLYVKGKHIGVFPLIVPIRSMEDHKPFPGVHVGDIGPKFGFNTMDNGFLSLDKVRVPRFNLLQRYIQVSRDGKVTRPKGIDPRITYSTMVQVRTSIAAGMGHVLAKAVTVAVRYASVRRQFGEAGKPESPVLDYGIVQYRVIPLVAKTYALLGMAHEFREQYERCMSAIEEGDFSLLKEMHASSCGLKRWSSETAIYGVDTCRHLCGGHGFSQFSGLNEYFADNYPNIIWEGDNYMLAQQTVRYLIKTANSIACGESVGVNDTSNALTRYYNKGNRLSAAQLYTWANRSPSEIVKSKQLLLDILAYRFAVMVQQLATKVYVEKRPFEDFLVTAQTVCTAHAEFIVCLYFGKHIEKLPANSPLRPALDAMYCISALSFLTRNTGELYALPKEASVTRELIEALNTEYLNSIKAARTIAVPLVDALKVPDETLNSSLGREDGKVYEDYMARALEEPLNRDGTGDAIRKSFFDKYIGPTLKGPSGSSKL
ncbi:Peroxisomal acyl-coenzyme A oxidase 1 [Zancudomyces culisetae]|uniref:Acyl-coenzyme A oxidase n=1 Tax=Zancudomyces culisetae TaxID=1213189 RepID=A0A1R1PG31_ZANCU|nr:Peroxisomal acyl-coenzyme A oxidase 1 [Zancudomyces culisetae]|eukprot:OMH79945.1 Peroxisomal acyl-coenzyme A oxidase 1 [Zancudomyces culisetae]